MKIQSIIMLSIFLPVFFCSPPPQRPVYFAKPSADIFDTSLTALYIPLDTISLSVIQEKDLAALRKSNPLYLFAKKSPVSRPSIINDTFFIEMANTLAQYEILQHYKVYKPGLDTVDTMAGKSMHLKSPARYSRLARDTGSFEKVSDFVKKAAEKYSVDLVVIPYNCSVKESENRKKAWRGDKYGKYYEKPSTVAAKALFHIQIWDKNGVLYYEREGTGLNKRSVYYYAFNKQNRPADQSIVEFTKNIFAPSAVRALGEACRSAFNGR